MVRSRCCRMSKMLTYRATIRPYAATRSPWQADMLFGHLCWLIRYEEGTPALLDFLEFYRRGEPPMLFSNGFPGNWLPRPLLPPAALPTDQPKHVRLRARQQMRAAEEQPWLDLEAFNTLRSGRPVPPATIRPRLSSNRTIFKQPVNRLSGSATVPTSPTDDPDQGTRYPGTEWAYLDQTTVPPAGLDISMYVRVRDSLWARRAENLLRRLSRSGYGAKKSSGYGHFGVIWEQFDGFDAEPPEANGFISLSHWTPARDDPTDGFYNLMVKYGKLGEELATSVNPFKFPLTMLTAGSAFYADAPIRNWYGRLVTGIAPVNPQVVQYAFAFALPARLTGEPSA